MFSNLPLDWNEFSEWNGDRISPFTDDLLRREIGPDSVDGWLSDWSRLACLIAESFNRLYIRTTTHTNDENGQNRFKRYSQEVMPQARAFEQRMREKLLGSGLCPQGMTVPLKKMASDAAIYRPENLPLRTQCENLETDYYAVTGAMTVDWDGETLNPPQVLAKLCDPDRNIRERAWRALSECRAERQAAIDQIWVQLLDLRMQMARNAGFDDYRAYRWQELGRFYYTPDDCKAFDAAIHKVVVPTVGRLSERRKRGLSLETLRVWDDHWRVKPDWLARPPLMPFEPIDQLISAVERVFTCVDPAFASYYRTLRQEGLLDLDARTHKAQAGYMSELPASKRAFIFATAVGLHDDVVTLLHESGHSFHVFEAARWPYHCQSMLDFIPIEFVEFASTAMELLASPYLTLDRGGFYTEDQLARARAEDLETSLGFWPYMAVVDAFQHWVYENPDAAHDTRQCDQVWASLHRHFLPHLDWSGIEDTLRTLWRFQLHIILSPFYYIEYGIARLGAVQLWANALEDSGRAVVAYRSALSLGNTASLPDLYKAAGVELDFGIDSLARAVQLMERTIAELEGT